MIQNKCYGLAFILLGIAIGIRPAEAQTVSFLRQIVTPEGAERASGVAADATGVYVAGYATRPLGASDRLFVRKYEPGGAELWNRRFGGPWDGVTKIALDATGIYVAGEAADTLPGELRPGDFSAFVRKYDTDGNELWTRQFGSSARDRASAVAADGAGVYVVGQMGAVPGGAGEAFVRKYDPNGTELWTRRFSALATDVAVDAGGAYVMGYGQGELGSPFLRKYDGGGNQLWTRQLDTSGFANRVAVGGSGVYVTAGTPESGFIAKYDDSGNQLWTRRVSTSPGLTATDATGVYLIEGTNSTLPGQCTAGASDIVVHKYDHGGTEVWTRQFGTFGYDYPGAVAVNGTGVYVVGNTNLAKRSTAFLAKLENAAALANELRPKILWDCVVNAASNVGGGVAPGEMVTIFGSGIGPPQFEQRRAGRLATTLAETRVLFNGIPAPLLSVSEKQSSAIVPYGVAGSSTVAVQVEYKGVTSDVITLPALDAHPGIFTQDNSGGGPATAINEDGTLNSPSNPAPPGSIVTIYATGEGLTDPPGEDGLLLTNVLPRPKLPVSVIFANEWEENSYFLRAKVLYAGAVAYSVTGLLQVDMRLPEGLPSGSARPQLVIGPDDFEPGAGPWSWVTRTAATISVGQAGQAPSGP